MAKRFEMIRMEIALAGTVFVHEFPAGSLPDEEFSDKALDMLDQMYQNIRQRIADRLEDGL
jgi:hypothetical protein